MIQVGLTSVADHPSLASRGATSTLADLAGHFPVVELDTTFYAQPSVATVQAWQRQVPPTFRFILKATQYMTRHKTAPDHELVAEFTAFRRGLAPLLETNQLAAILFQLPPYFGVTLENVRYLRQLRRLYPDLPIALEFRNNGWYSADYQASTFDLMRTLKLTHVVVDEPQTPAGSVAQVPVVTTADLAILRLHGRNTAGWLERDPQWRSRRTNYRYSEAALQSLGAVARQLPAQQVIVIFNNNGGHDAAANARTFIAQQNLTFDGLGPSQLDLF
ncbi:DUF72 domain-containing protein [Lacticaseibacillus daqingensis]|uniref:DUF72 domain-containing protein n=1 Tax=Lacticaseibacillus daqingensis TaxID=2486014 RepID=UPI000F7A19C0|nr:DUF72 domain-containing protein [Lacticaseibacillus daqingensis]